MSNPSVESMRMPKQAGVSHLTFRWVTVLSRSVVPRIAKSGIFFSYRSSNCWPGTILSRSGISNVVNAICAAYCANPAVIFPNWSYSMATREARIAEFKCDPPIEDKPVRILCEDHIGTYAVPFPCVYREGMWRNAGTGEPIEADVIGWAANLRP